MPVALLLAVAVSMASAQGPGGGSAKYSSGGDAPVRVAERSDTLSIGGSPRLGPSQPNEHPLMPALRWAQQGLPAVQAIQDYSATMVKRERVGGKLGEPEYMFIKIRHRPFSVYMYFLGPQNLKGQEVIFVQGQNNGNMWAHTVGVKDALVGTVSLKPDGFIAMQGNRYPLTEIGLVNLVRRLVLVAEQDVQYGECEVKFFQGAKINGRTCTCIEVVHPFPRSNFLFHLARIFVDDELNVPIRYESYDWPKGPGAKPELIEEYTYLNLKLNNGFTDADFDIKNPNYRFR
jgi:outer membrane lipoprotein-sorting protein